MANGPTTPPAYLSYFPDAWDELDNLDRWHQHNEAARAAVGDITPDQARGAADIARVIPNIGPGVLTSLARFGTRPDSPVVKFLAGQTALMNRRKDMYFGIQGTVVDAAQLQQGSPRSHLRTTLQAANAAGLMNENGQLVEPAQGDPHSSWLWQEVRDAFRHAETDLPYIARDGTPQRHRLTHEHRQSVEMQRRREGRAGEAAARARQGLEAEGFLSAERLMRDNPEIAPLVQQMIQRGWVDESGYIVRPEFPEETQGAAVEHSLGMGDTPRHEGGSGEGRPISGLDDSLSFWSSAMSQFNERGIDLPFLTGAGPVVLRNDRSRGDGDDAYWDYIRPQWTEEIEEATLSPELQASGIGEIGYAGLRTAGQRALMTINAPLQEVQGLVRNAWAAAHGKPVDWTEAQSDLGIYLGGERDVGHGYFVDPRSDVARERVRREAERGQIAGHNVTLGRIIGNATGLEPGTRPYSILSGLVDASVAVGADPSSYALAGLGRAARARTTFRVGEEAAGAADDVVREAGALRGLTDAVRGPSAQHWLDSTAGQQVTASIAATDSPSAIWQATNRKLPVELAAQLADEADPQVIADTLRPLLGMEFPRTTDLHQARNMQAAVVEAPTPRGTPISSHVPGLPRVSQGVRRLLAQVPESTVDTYDLTNAVKWVEDWGLNARMDPDVMRFHMDTVARSRNRSQLYTNMNQVMQGTDGLLESAGVTNAAARRRLTQLFSDTTQGARHWFVDEVGSDVPVWDRILTNGEVQDVGAGPHLITEFLSRNMQMPDYRAVRRLTTNPAMRMLTTKHSLWNFEKMTGELRTLPAALGHLQDTLWKPVTLARAGWTARVVGEEQLRMGAAHLHSMFNHPISYIGWRVGKKGNADVLGNSFEEAAEFQQAMTRGRSAFFDEPNVVRSHDWVTFAKGADDEAEFLRGWGEELSQLYYDPIARTVAQSDSLDDVVDWMTNGAGQRFTSEFDGTQHSLRNAQGGIDGDAVRRYVETVDERIGIKTGGNADLMELVKTGRINGKTLFDESSLRFANPDYRGVLRGHLDDAPSHVKGERVITVGRGDRLMEGWDRATSFMFDHLMTRRTNNLSRSPTFKQFYWREVGELAGRVDDPGAVVRAAEEAGISGRAMRRITKNVDRRVAGEYTPRQPITMDEMDFVAKGRALDQTKALLYDLTNKHQVADSMRLVAPFGEAWLEMATTWPRLLAENPAVVRRGAQVIEGGQESGFFYENEFGELVFTYPGSQWLTEQTLGAPIPLTGSVEGLSMMTQVLPGLGPALQIPVAYFIGQHEQFRDWADHLVPFGAPGVVGDQFDPSEAINPISYAPPWMKRGLATLTGRAWDADTQRQYINSQMQVARYLGSTGKYDLADPAQFQQLMEDAATKSRMFFAIRTFASFGAPSAPSPRWLMETDEGLIATAVLVQEHWNLRQQDFDTADEVFLEKYGDDAVLALTPLSKTLSWGLTPSQEFADWAQSHGDLRQNYPSTYALFGPMGDADDFQWNVYMSQFEGNEREALAPDEWMRLSQHLIASRMKRKATRIVGPERDFDTSLWLNDLDEALHREYPGYENLVGVPEGPSAEAAIHEIRRLIENESDIARTPLGEAVSTFLTARDMAQQEAEALGYVTFKTATGAEHIRTWLRELGAALSRERPGFERIFDYVFSSELEQGEETRIAEHLEEVGQGSGGGYPDYGYNPSGAGAGTGADQGGS
jgi:hypothetical protein